MTLKMAVPSVTGTVCDLETATPLRRLDSVALKMSLNIAANTLQTVGRHVVCKSFALKMSLKLW